MSHYDDLEAAKAYNEKLEKKYTFNRTVPVGNTDDLFNGKPSTIDAALEFCADRDSLREDPNYTTIRFSDCLEDVSKEVSTVSLAKKETKNKAEGARYCYLSSIASASHYAGCPEDQIGKYLDGLLEDNYRGPCTTQHILNMIITYCGLAMGDDKDLWDGVVAVRMKGLNSGKYDVNNHKLPMQKHLLLDAAARHLISYLYINHIDDESGESHLCHIVANVLMFAAQLNIEKGE